MHLTPVSRPAQDAWCSCFFTDPVRLMYIISSLYYLQVFMMFCNYKLFFMNVVPISKQMLRSLTEEMVHSLVLTILPSSQNNWFWSLQLTSLLILFMVRSYVQTFYVFMKTLLLIFKNLLWFLPLFLGLGSIFCFLKSMKYSPIFCFVLILFILFISFYYFSFSSFSILLPLHHHFQCWFAFTKALCGGKCCPKHFACSVSTNPKGW